MVAMAVCVKFKATTESDETTTAALMTTVSQQTSAADSSPSTVADDTTTVTDSQTQTSQSYILARIYSWLPEDVYTNMTLKYCRNLQPSYY